MDMTYTAQRHPGRRSSDTWGRFTKVVGLAISLAALVGILGKVLIAGAQVEANTADVAALTTRVQVLERFQEDGHYMTCYMFREENPRGLPASCDLFLSREAR